MAEMSVIWLRVAAALYSLGLLHAILTLVRRREHLFRVALGAFGLGSVFHFVSIIEEGLLNNRCPINNFYETLSMCAFLIVHPLLVRAVEYKVASLSVFIFPLVFVMALVLDARQSRERLVEPGGPQRLAHGAYRARAAGLRRPAPHRGGVGALPVSGARAQSQEAAQSSTTGCPRWARWTT